MTPYLIIRILLTTFPRLYFTSLGLLCNNQDVLLLRYLISSLYLLSVLLFYPQHDSQIDLLNILLDHIAPV